MADLDAKDFSSPDEVRPFQAHGKMEIVRLGDMTVGRGTFEPGWRWSNDVKPIAKTEDCEAAHTGYVVSGRMRIKMRDGTESEAGPGSVVAIAPGHDAWTVGNEPCVLVDFGANVGQYARSS